MLIPAPFIAFPHVSPPSRSFDVADAATVIGGDGGDSIDPNDPPGKGAPAVFPPETVKTADNGGRYVDGKDGIVARSSVEHPWIVYLPDDDLEGEGRLLGQERIQRHRKRLLLVIGRDDNGS